MKKRELEALIAALDLRLGKTERELAFISREYDKTRSIVMNLLQGVGGHVWITYNGTKRVLIALSTPHLKAILGMTRVGDDIERAIQKELARRELDALYRSLDEAKTEKARKRLRAQILAAGGHLCDEVRKFNKPCAWKFKAKK